MPKEEALKQRLSGGTTAFAVVADVFEDTDSATLAAVHDDATSKPKTRKELLAEVARIRQAITKQEKLNALAATDKVVAVVGLVASIAKT